MWKKIFNILMSAIVPILCINYRTGSSERGNSFVMISSSALVYGKKTRFSSLERVYHFHGSLYDRRGRHKKLNEDIFLRFRQSLFLRTNGLRRIAVKILSF